EGKDGVARVDRILLVRIIEIGGAYQAVVAFESREVTGCICVGFRDVMEHQDPLAEPIRADLKSRAVGGERVVSNGPGNRIAFSRIVDWLRSIGVVFAIIQHGLEHPIGVSRQWSGWLIRSIVREKWRSIAVTDALEVAIGRTGLVGAI